MKQYNEYIEKPSVVVELNDGSVKDCFIIATPKGQYGTYIALLPKEKEYFISGKLLLFKLIENDDFSTILGIDDDAEFEYADDLLDEIILDQGYIQILQKYKDKYL